MADGDRTLTLTQNLAFAGNYTNEWATGNEPRSISKSLALALSNGTGTKQADLWYEKRRSIGTGGENLDLTGGLTDIFGNALTFVEIRLILIENRSTTAGENLKVGGHATAAWLAPFANATDIDIVTPEGVWLRTFPQNGNGTVVLTTGDLLTVAAAAGTISYDIFIAGASA